MRQLFNGQHVIDAFKNSKPLSIGGAVFAVIVFILIYSFSHKHFYDQVQESFEKDVNKDLDSIIHQFDDYELILISSNGLLKSSHHITNQEWLSFVGNLHIHKRFSSIQSIGYAQLVTTREIPSLEKKMHQDGFTSFKVITDENRSLYAPILYTEPMYANLLYSNGYDLFCDPIHKEAMQRAQESSAITITQKMNIAKDLNFHTKTGMFMYLPVYSSDSHNSVQGFVFLSFVTKEFVDSINKNDNLLLKIYDASNASKELVYETISDPSYISSHAVQKVINIFGRKWVFVYSSSPRFDRVNKNEYPLLIVFLGMMLYFILFYVIVELLRNRKSLLKKTRELESSRSWLDLLLNSSIDAIHILDMQGKIIGYSPSFLQMFGYTKEEAENLSIFAIEALLSKEDIENKIRSSSANPDTFQTLLRKKDDTIFDAELSIKSIEIDGQKYIYASARNISEICHAKMELQSSKEFYETMFASLNDAIIILQNNIIMDCNYSAIKLLRSSKESLVGAHILDTIYDVECKEHSFYHYLDSAHQGEYKTAECSFHLKGKTNEIKIMEFSLSKFGKQNENKLIMVARDITKEVENEKFMKMYTRQAQMGEMISMIAHQWRQPLAVINAIVSQMRLKAMLQDTQDSEYINSLIKIEAQTVHLSQTISDYRNFFDPDKLKECFYLSSLIKDARGLVEHILENHSVSFEYNQINDCVVYTYRNEVLQVLLVLLKNALDIFIEQRIENAKIIVSVDHDERYSTISVHDNAGGIADKVMKKLFTPYFTTKGKNEGTGLGLYMSKLIIHEHCDGEITVSSKNGETVFSVRLPYQKEIQNAIEDKH